MFFFVFGLSILAGYLKTFVSTVIFLGLLAFLMVQSIRGFLSWVFNPDPFSRFIEHSMNACILAYVGQKNLRFLLRFFLRHLVMRKKIEGNLAERAARQAARTLRQRGPEAKDIMRFIARLRPVMGEIRKASQISEQEGIISLQKKFIIAFLVTLVVIFLGFSTATWNLHILDIYQLVDKEGVAVHSFVVYLYFTMITISTVGYGDVVPANDFARIFSIIEIFTGFFLIVIIIASFANITMKLYRMQRQWLTKSK